MQNLTFEELCGLLRDEFGSAAVSSPQHPRVGDGDPVTGDLILREEGASSFIVGAQDRGQWSELGQFPSEAEACDFILRRVRHSHRPGVRMAPAEKAESERVTRDFDAELRRTLGLDEGPEGAERTTSGTLPRSTESWENDYARAAENSPRGSKWAISKPK